MTFSHFRLLAKPEETVSGDMIYEMLCLLAEHTGKEVYFVSDVMKRRYAGDRAKGALLGKTFRDFFSNDNDMDFCITDFFPTRSLDISVDLLNETPAFSNALVTDIAELCSRFLTVQQAYSQNNDYHAWQQANQPERFERSNRPKPDLPIIDTTSNPKYPRIIYDISHNPGHFKFKPGFIEIPTADLWASDTWMKELGVDMEALSELYVSAPADVAPGIRHYKFFAHPFDSDQGEQRDIQIKLRRILFHTELGDREGLNF